MKKTVYQMVLIVVLMLIVIVFIRLGREKDHTHKPWEQEQVTLHIIHWNLLPSSIIDKFEKENPNIKIYTELYSVDDYVKIMETKLVNGDLPDIMGAQENTFKKYVDENIYMDLTDEPLLDNYMDEAIYELKDFSDDHKIYSIPTNAFSLGVWINRDLFIKNNIPIPTTADELMVTAEQFKNKGIPPFVEGVKDGWPVIQTMFPMFELQMSNENVFDNIAVGEAKWNEGEVRDSFHKWSDLFAKEGNLVEGAYDLTYGQAWEHFEQGIVPMWPMGSWANHFIMGENGALKKLGFNIDFIPIYSKDTEGNQVIPGTYIGAMYAIPSSAKHSEEAIKFLNFITRPENAIEFSYGSGAIVPVKNLNLEDLPPYLSVVANTTLNNQLVRPFNMLLDVKVNDQLTSLLQQTIAGSNIDEELDELQRVQDEINKVSISN